MAVRAVVFDIGGVLEFTPDLGIAEKWEPEFGAGWTERMAEVFDAGGIGAITLEHVHERMAEILGVSADRVDAFFADMWVEYVGTLNTELVEYWRRLHDQGYATAIISNSFVGATEREEAAYHFSEMADVIVYSHEAGWAKPDPRIYELCLDRLAVSPDEAVFLDDWEPAVEGARAVGMHAVQFVDTAQAIRDIDAILASR